MLINKSILRYKLRAEILKSICLLVLSLLIAGHCHAAVWQWAVDVKNTKDNNGHARAYLWIPENCKKLKAIIIAQNNMEEQSILENKHFRDEMAKLNIGELWVSPAFNLFFNFNQGAGENLNEMLGQLATVSGYNELTTIPFIGMGHSAAASNPYYMAAWNPDRALAAISVSGQWPYVRTEPFMPDIWGERNIDYIPCLETMGEYEAADTWSAEGLQERKNHPLLPLSMLACPAQGHFAATQEKIDYIAFYIGKAMQYRLPAGNKLRPLNPTTGGWLADKWRFNSAPLAAPAPVGRYKGNPDEAFWFFDRETAERTARFGARHRNQQPQLVGYVQAGQMVKQQNTHQQIDLKFMPEADGITFRVKARLYDTVPGGSPRIKAWTGMETGSPIGHTATGKIKVDIITGPVIKLNDSTFQVSPQLGYWPSAHSYEAWFAAVAEGDETYKPAVQQAKMALPPLNTEGRPQHISFKAIPNQHYSKNPIRLSAASDADVPVRFYIAYGPAIVNGDKLELTAVPPAAKYPVKVSVIAWQYGNRGNNALQTAEPVEQTFLIER